MVGGGFAGLSAVRALEGADVDVLLLDRDLDNTFQPLLYQVATGGLNPGDVTYALRAFAARFANAQFRRVTVTGVDAARRCVRTDAGDEIGYDYLLLCCGVTAPGGVEMAGTLAELRNVALPVTYPELDLERVRVVLVEMTDRVLGPFAPRLRRYTAKQLRKRGVELRLGVAVKEVHKDGVVLSDGERLPSAATV